MLMDKCCIFSIHKRCCRRIDCLNSANTDIIILIDEGKWYKQKVKEVLAAMRDDSNLSRQDDRDFRQALCFGRISEHIIDKLCQVKCTCLIHTG